MGDVIPFPPIRPPDPGHFDEMKAVGEERGITVRIVARRGWPHDLLVVLTGTVEGWSTVAAVPAGELAQAETTAHAVLSAIEAAELTWSIRTA